MPRVYEYLYHKGANTFCFYRLTIAGGGEWVGFPCEPMYAQVYLELQYFTLDFILFVQSSSSIII